MKLRIALVGACPFPVPQGSQVFLRDNALALQARGHEVHLVVYAYGDGPDTSGLTLHRCRPIPGEGRTAAGPSLAKPFQDLALVLKLRQVVRRHQIDAVIAHNYEALLVGLAAGTRPLIYHAHNAMADELPYYFRWKTGPALLGRWLDHSFPRRAARVIVPHERLAAHLKARGCARDQIAVVPPPLQVEDFAVGEVSEALPPVLYTGNLDAYQNLGLLFDAMERVRLRFPGARLQIATAADATFPDAEVLPVKNLDALRRVLAGDAVVALPRTSWSGYPIKLLNAMAAGKAIVACQSAAYPLSHEVNGLIVPDGDADAFATALIRLMADPALRRKLGAAARARVAREHEPEAVGRQLETVVLNAMGPSNFAGAS